jgi:oxysterol-binding protein-related protein 8
MLTHTTADQKRRDGPTPDKQAEQIMAIYPIVKGQKNQQKNVIPPRSQPSSPRAPSSKKEEDLIDFGQWDAKPSENGHEIKPTLDSTHKSTAEIQSLLAATGSRAHEGPLIDFQQDMKKNLP